MQIKLYHVVGMVTALVCPECWRQTAAPSHRHHQQIYGAATLRPPANTLCSHYWWIQNSWIFIFVSNASKYLLERGEVVSRPLCLHAGSSLGTRRPEDAAVQDSINSEKLVLYVQQLAAHLSMPPPHTCKFIFFENQLSSSVLLDQGIWEYLCCC